MKVCALAIIVAICTIQIAYADWREDLKKKHVDRLVNFVDGMEDLLRVSIAIIFISIATNDYQFFQSSAATKSTAAAWECYKTASEKFSELIDRHSVNVDRCVAPPADEAEATKCCDKLKKSMIKEASIVSSTASECIDDSS
ncbi:hypothetical protein TSAR_008731 [Trichomalopsis sarcophagae]|uniref:Protein TsetseEP domain-containing protein n=1 Tax=Trichomalopsis sarcophagae TaxID=543379 RepID=A0A232EW94_9HYME|nr:hypothetical protein TSAR_008731 [Trichomalopsis sarcophagae]